MPDSHWLGWREEKQGRLPLSIPASPQEGNSWAGFIILAHCLKTTDNTNGNAKLEPKQVLGLDPGQITLQPQLETKCSVYRAVTLIPAGVLQEPSPEWQRK